MIVNNIDLIKSLLVFPEGCFYYVQVIQRKKDHPDISGDYKRYQCFITSMDDLNLHLPRIISVCEEFGARAYISLTTRSLEKLGKQCLLEYATRVGEGVYTRVWDIPNRVALSDKVRLKVKGKPRWILDIDVISDVDAIVSECSVAGVNIISKIPTVYGIHLLVEAFNPNAFGSAKMCGEDLILPTGERATLRRECLTVLYAA